MKACNRLVLGAAVAVAFVDTGSVSHAGGFAIGSQNGSGTGNAYAGGAATAEDASVVWSNPAGMTELQKGRHVTGALHIVNYSFKFSNTGSTGLLALPGTGEGGDGGGWALIPNVYLAMDVTDKFRVGVAVNPPFGLTTEYDNGWRGQLTALKSQLKAINVNPAIAYAINNALSVGAGVSVQRLEAELTSGANVAGTNTFKLTAKDVGYGFNVGATLKPGDDTRIGIHYRSSVKYKLDGTASFSLTPALNGPVSADLKTPDMVSLSFFHKVARSKWEIMGDLTWNKWSNLQQLTVVRGTPLPAIPALQFSWRDTLRLGLGASYVMNGQTKLRFGVAHDQTPANDQFRTARLPDQQRNWIAFGIQHRISGNGVIDAGYVHEFAPNSTINNATPAGSLVGNFRSRADFVSMQYSHRF